jgi:hypothetical protein
MTAGLPEAGPVALGPHTVDEPPQNGNRAGSRDTGRRSP